jgi:hypothetical protein
LTLTETGMVLLLAELEGIWLPFFNSHLLAGDCLIRERKEGEEYDRNKEV